MSWLTIVTCACFIGVAFGADRDSRHINVSPHHVPQVPSCRWPDDHCSCATEKCHCGDKPAGDGCGCHSGPSPVTNCACGYCESRIEVCDNECSSGQVQDVTEDTVLVCSPESYFSRLEFHGGYQSNTSCNGVFAANKGYVPGIFTAYRKLPDGKEVDVTINSADFRLVVTFNSGNAQRFLQSPLAECECAGDVLTALATYVADDPLNGCCRSGVSLLTAVQLALTISGKCCSQCSLQSSTIRYKHPATN